MMSSSLCHAAPVLNGQRHALCKAHALPSPRPALSGRRVAAAPSGLATAQRRGPSRYVRCRVAPIQRPSEETVLVGDIGGTNSRLQLWSLSDSGNKEVFRKDLKNKEYSSFSEVVEAFLALPEAQAAHPAAGCFAIAGPVDQFKQTAVMTNLGWDIAASKLEEVLGGAPCALLNDFQAIGYGVRALDDGDIEVLHQGVLEEGQPIAVIGPGTGLGACQAFWDSGRRDYVVVPGEGSHSDFAPRTPRQMDLARFCYDELGRSAEIEEVGCGSGLERIYRFLGGDTTSIDAAGISKLAGEGDELAVEALSMMLEIVGQEAGHMAIRSLAFGGVYIAGGIVPKNIQIARNGRMLNGFLNPTSRLSELHAKFPLYVVKNESVGLLGALHYATYLAQR
ncbi:unnamed protein product [Pedinophyceae sp. YPF-701]|nr:unnamed protein product [Pedinophyceae sp. YPF-701]